MTIALAADHAGHNYKTLLLEKLTADGYTVTDLGGDGTDLTDDYPDYADKMAYAIENKVAHRGIIICGSGVGVSVAANKYRGVRAGVCHDSYSAHQCVEHDNANVLCLGERVIGVATLYEVVGAFVKAQFSGEERHVRRLAKIAAIEDRNML